MLVHRPAVYIPCTYVHACIYIEGSLNARKCTYPPLDEHRYGKQPPFADPFPNRKQPSIPYRLDHVVVNVLHGRVPQQTKYDGIRMILKSVRIGCNGIMKILKSIDPWDFS